ncbi:enoyl-CoA hydratase [Pasteurellaceae bacterium Macca]|nr:enoyl-CoA hydratase [Pasteurellaceae bacterium Macca]
MRSGEVYLALYKGEGNWVDKVIRVFTRGRYSHCEIAVFQREIVGHYHAEEWFDSYSSSPRDGGVRCKKFSKFDRLNWDLIPLSGISEAQIHAFFHQTQGAKYDFVGAIGILFGIRQSKTRWFCSEWCWQALGGEEGWRFSPSALGVIIKRGKTML